MDPAAPPAADLSPQDREWLTLYLDCNEDLQALAARLASQHAARLAHHDPGPRTQDPGPSLVDLALWLRTPPIRAALAAWDYAQRRARAARDEADRRVALDALKAVCQRHLSAPHRTHPSHKTHSPPSGDPPCHRQAPSGDSLPSSPSSTQLVGAESPAPPDHTSLVELRRAATTILRTLSRAGAMATARRGYGRRHAESRAHGLTGSRAHPSRPRRIADFNLGPADAARFLEKERRENDRLAALVKQATAVADAAREHLPPSPPGQPTAGTPPHPDPFSSDLAFARHVLHSVEAGTPEAAAFTPQIVDAARTYVSIFAEPPPAPAAPIGPILAHNTS